MFEMHINMLEPTFGDNALQAHHAAQQARGQGARGDVFIAETSLQAYEELLMLLGISCIY